MTSPSNTVISLPGQSIVDATGNVWTIVNGRVAVNGVVDPTTANVIEMAYENGTIWQKNSNDLWWGKTSPTAAWSPPYGTTTDPIPNQIASPNNTVVVVTANTPPLSITDSTGNIWSISGGQVTLNGVKDPTTANVVELAYINGEIWQKNAAGLWWGKTRPSDPWGPTYGTSTSPVMASRNNTVISLPGQSIIDTKGNVWTIVSGRVALNGIIDPTTANVIQMAYENGEIWRENSNDWWSSKSSPAAPWSAPSYGYDPIPNRIASLSDTIVTIIPNMPTSSITDDSGNIWSINGGQVTLNGVKDPATANVVELAFTDGEIWQKNAAGLWWGKYEPSNPWNPANGTTISPVADAIRVWIGGSGAFDVPNDWAPGGVPQAGDTAVIGGGVTMTPGFGTGVNFDLEGGGLNFTQSGTFNTGTWSGSGGVLLNYPGKDVVVTTTGIHMTGGSIAITQFIEASGRLAIHGNSSLTAGAQLSARMTGTAGLGYAPLESDGTMIVNDSTLLIGDLDGQGILQAANGSSLTVGAASASETVQLVSAHLYIGVVSEPPVSTAMQFLAPITDFGATSEITLDNTTATKEVFDRTRPTAGQVLLYNGSTIVADLHISGQPAIYASDVSPGSDFGSVALTPYDTGHSIPVTGL